jgi:thiol-disulfide isomerase/thioredoxin
MKKLLLFALVICAAHFSVAQKTALKKFITIKGRVDFINPEPYARLNKVWLGKRLPGSNQLVDSVTIAPDGSWQLKVNGSVPGLYSIDIAKWDRVTVYTDADMVVNSRGYDTAKVKIKNPPYVFVEGSADNNFINLVDHAVYRNYQTMIAESKEIYYAGLNKDTAWSAYVKKKDPYKLLNEDFSDRLRVLIRAYRDRPVVLYALGMLNWESDTAIIMPVLKNLKKKYPWFKDAGDMQKDMEDRLAQARLLKPGKPIPPISYPDQEGRLQALEQFKGKYLLIDFWASWCGPCRAAVPKVKRLYAQYKDKGFEVVSISIDDSKSAWIKAMEEEQMPWQQWLSPDKMATMKNFLFSAIPTLYLVDREGKIISSYTGYSENMEQRIAGLFPGGAL